jgi:hypothetical protein
MVAPWRWFARTYGIAVVAHLAGNAPIIRVPEGQWLTVSIALSIPLGIAALALIVSPSRVLLGTTAVLVLASLWTDLPYIGNHWLVIGFVAVAVLASLAMRDPWAWFSVTGRWVLLGFYSFAAFAKLNTGFFDPGTSCGVFYANQSLSSFGLPAFDTHSPFAWLLVAGPVMTEMSVPILLAFTRTRRIGVLVALTFHTIISADLDQHFYDFTAALVMLLCLFLPESTLRELEAGAGRRTRVFAAGIAVCLLSVAAAVLPQSGATVAIIDVLPFVAWFPFAGWLISKVARGGLGPSPVPMRPPSAVTWLLLAVIVANGLSPYLELKTAFGFNMYANLVTVAGESNHLIVRDTLHLSHAQDHLLTVVDTNDPGLRHYADDGYLIPERNLLDYLARHPSATVVVSDADGRRTLDGSDGVRLPLLVSKLLLFRAVDEHDPPRCQAVWLPAR